MLLTYVQFFKPVLCTLGKLLLKCAVKRKFKTTSLPRPINPEDHLFKHCAFYLPNNNITRFVVGKAYISV